MLTRGDKILFISQYAGFIGGLERYIHAVATLLRENGFKTYSLYVEKTHNSDLFLSAFDGYWDINQIDSIKEEDFALSTLHKISSPDIFSKILTRFTPTLFVHDHDYYCPKGFKYYPYKRLNCSRRYQRLICGICSSLVPPRHITNGLCNMLQRNFISSYSLFQLATSCKAFVVLSEFMKKNLLRNGISADKITVLHPFLDTPILADNSSKIKRKIPQIVFAGQQVMSKGTPLFLEAVAKLKSVVSAHILGTGSRLNDFKNLAHQMGLKDRVAFDGWIENPNEFFAQSDLAVFPSLWQEPFGLSGIEAMSCGIPVVGFDVGGVSEWLKDGLNGFLIPERDTTRMAMAIDHILTDSHLRKTLGQNAQKYVAENYSKQNFLNHFIQLA